MSARADRQGFTLLEVMIATIILSLGLAVLLPIPSPDLVTGDPLEDEQLNIQETTAGELLDDLEISQSDLPKDRRDELLEYTFERKVDEVDDEELKRAGYLYTLRTLVRWGSTRMRDDERPKLEVLTLWRKKQ